MQRKSGFDPCVEKIPWRRAVLLLGESHGQRSLAGYNPWGRKESDTTEGLTLSLSGPFMLPFITLLFSCSVTFGSLRPHGLWPFRLLCPRNSPGKNTGMGYHFLLQGIFPTQGSNLDLLLCRQILYHLSHQGSPFEAMPFPCVWVFQCPL